VLSLVLENLLYFIAMFFYINVVLYSNKRQICLLYRLAYVFTVHSKSVHKIVQYYLSFAVMYVSRQKSCLKAAKVLPQPRLEVLMPCLASWSLLRPHLSLVSSASSRLKASEPLSYITILLFITFIHSSFLYMCMRPSIYV